ncbi:outer membrane autotransporter barrel domain protein 4 [Achromobacter xylosoxidans A8]|uniref:Outer membrane autotransporter barrel domain protein 4 n=1 Tax=Achromobacter xylosoxidans (strain A8) TaxID=762376 RepID=E3HES1_ACHXA|nr:autotransporter outer membrane beta-barrel domain-containing protein [Achromobacter xylosoxidans]ADP16480.1 outer membrane autotransporter barrel domain protein 4 [Achromobacter xylosoxidans A8]
MKPISFSVRNPGLPFPLLRQNTLRLAVVSALGACAWGATGSAQAGYACAGGPSLNVSSGNYPSAQAICEGDSGVDHNDEKDGQNGPDVSVTSSGNYSADANQTRLNPLGVVTALSRGGDGVDEGTAGDGGNVTVSSSGDVALNGTALSNFNSLIMAVSSGGIGDPANDNNDSNGGHGGLGQTVTVTNSGNLTMSGSLPTPRQGLYGINARALGGAGGDQNDPTLEYGEQVGGNGGNASTVTVSNTGAINLGSSAARLRTYANGAAIYANSIGGMGGYNNGNAGTGGTVQVTHQGQAYSYWQVYDSATVFGIYAQSIGGDGTASTDNSDNGGNGGGTSDSWTQKVTVDVNGSVLLDVAGSAAGATIEGAGVAARAIGGKGGMGPDKDHSGGNGGAGGSVAINLYQGASVATRGDNLPGLAAQSLGGQGGDGSDSTALAGQGGGGGFGGNASAVNVVAASGSAISTTGSFATGIVAQSIGGGGGTGSDFVSVLGGQGGNGGNGGNAGTVTATTGGTITTSGDHAYGVLAQSIAGSGGAGGADTAELVSLGGDGAGGGAASQVTLNNTGSIATSGYNSHGMIGQSIGGGGGASGSATGLLSVGGSSAGATGSSGSTVVLGNTGSITTAGNAAIGMVAQSIGGGGGSGGDSIGVLGVGGGGAGGGAGGNVIIQDLGSIQTAGQFGAGVLAQSVGGGGGNGGDTFTASVGVSVAIGGSASGGGDGGSVCMSNQGGCDGTLTYSTSNIATHGNYAPGIIAQSVGGGGGTGGSVKNASVASFAALQLGGSGGGGGKAAEVKVGYSNLNISTGGAHSAGILAQSIGGGGGNGGDASYYDVTVGFNAAVVLGGSGGSGGTGYSSIVNLSSSHVATGMDYASPGIDPDTYAPNDSFGILAQTIGGGGGNGGSSSASDLVLAVPTGEGASLAFNFEAAVGGSGGAGSDACPAGDAACVTQVNLSNGSTVVTLGDGSHAVMAQSVGGGGGNGGDSSVLSTVLGDETTISLSAGMTLGGSGSGGGNGGAVSVGLGDANGAYAGLPPSLLTPPGVRVPPASTIVTYGDYANGVLAQSIGGGGGNGGVGSSNAYTHGGPTNVKLTLALGGTGGAGGTGGKVDVTLNPNYTIRTLGSGSRGIVAQSIGGGGGASQGGTLNVAGSAEDRPSARLQVGLGATGGSGATGGDINATLQGAIRTEGGDADGVLLQSIGGGGGLGGSLGADASSYPILDRIGNHSDNKERLDDENSTYQFGVDVGGTGGTGGHGGNVSVNYAGKIATAGDWADGLVAQSIGGGGGVGGSSSASGSKIKANAIIGVGGSGGAGGDGGNLSVSFDDDHGNSISTAGYSAYGVLLQSIGGGGGQGGDGSDQAQGTITVGASFGGTGGVAGNGGSILTSGGGGWLNVQTSGDDAPALAMQSIGGGGGTAGAGNSSSKLQQNSHSMSVSVGGSGGLAGSGGAIDVATGIAATTQGARAYGVLAQSIGGGGGLGGAGDASNLTGVSLGGRGGAAGDGGAVTLTLNAGGHISTSGAGSHGVIAQSIGGGGGIAGDISKGLQLGSGAWTPGSGQTGGSGSGGTLNLNVASNITTQGDYAYGVIAQSIGGGGGLGGNAAGGFAGSTAGAGSTGSGENVTVTQSGSIAATGAGATGIFAQSAGPQGSGQVAVTVNGAVSGGSGAGAYGVWIVGDKQNTLTVGTAGTITAGSGGSAVRYDGASLQQAKTASFLASPSGANLAINNAGTVLGNIECGGGAGGIACNVWNAATGTLSDATLYQANIDNAGLVAIGRSGAFDNLTVAGNFNLQAGGILQADVDFANLKSPRMVVQGDTRLDGQVNVQPITLLPDYEVTVATLQGDVQGSPAAKDSPVIDYDARLDGQDVRVRAVQADFAAPSMQLAANQRSVARHMQGAWNLGGNAAMASLFAALDMASREGADTYSNRLSDLSAGVTVAPAAQMQASMARFTGAMMSCPAFQGGDALTGEQDCLWGQVSGINTNQDGDGGVSGFSFDGVTYQFGGQRQVKPGWFLGGSVAYQNSHLSGDDGRVSGKGDSGYAGVVLKRETGPWTLSAALGGGYGQYDIDRSIRIPGMQSTANSDLDVYGAALRLRIARTYAAEHVYLKPYVDLDASYTHMPGYSESRNALHLDVESSNQFVMALSPTLELGGKVALKNGATMRPYMYGGVSFLSKDEYTVKAQLQGAPAGSGAFETSVPMDDVIGRVGAGLQVSNAGGIDFRLQYDGDFSSHIQSHRGTLKVMVPF